MSGRRHAFEASVALALGAASAVATVPLARMTMTAITDSTEVFLVRGTAVWSGIERRSAMIRWVNVETVGPLVSESVRIGEVPDWAEPAPPADVRLVRAAAVGIGWPLPLIAAAWRADRGDEVFPPPAERDTSGESPKEAVRRTLDGDPKATRTLLVPQAIADAVLLALPWWLLLRGISWMRARRLARAVTPPG
jgi:hypothetical protein